MPHSYGPPASFPSFSGIRNAHIGDVLTDRQIDRYILEGRYGEAAKQLLESQRAAKAARPLKKKTPSLDAILALL